MEQPAAGAAPAVAPAAASLGIARPGLTRRRRRTGEWLAERGIFVISLTSILMIFLIFAFVGREAIPIALGQVTTARAKKPLTAPEALALPAGQLAKYLGVTAVELRGFDADTTKTLIELKAEELAQIDNPDARLNAVSWPMLFRPHQWVGYQKPEYIWQPTSEIPKFNFVPLILGSLKATLVALLFSVPLGVGSAIYVSQLAPAKLREVIKPAIELLSGIPSVVLGFFGLIVLASVLQGMLGY